MYKETPLTKIFVLRFKIRLMMMTLWKKVFRYQIPSYLVNTLHIQNYVPISEIVFQYFHFFLACVIFNLEHLEA